MPTTTAGKSLRIDAVVALLIPGHLLIFFCVCDCTDLKFDLSRAEVNRTVCFVGLCSFQVKLRSLLPSY